MRLVLAGLVIALVASCSSSSPDTRTQALSYARDGIACVTGTDCCAVEDGCLSDMLLVSATDQEHVTALLAAAPTDKCLACITPPVQVECRGGVCVMVELVESSATADYNATMSFRQSHCGAMTVPADWQEQASGQALGSDLAPATVLGCGAGN
jgi:hypothetical protein